MTNKNKAPTDNITEGALVALKKAEQRGEKIRQALDFIRYGDKSKTIDGQALADAGNNLSALRTFVGDAIAALQNAQSRSEASTVNPASVDVDGLYRIARTAACPKNDPDCTVCDFSHGADMATDAFIAQGYLHPKPGFVMVPAEPTEEMINAARDRPENGQCDVLYYSIYKTMIQSAQEQSHE